MTPPTRLQRPLALDDATQVESGCRMDWFCALVESSPGFRAYSEMVMVAVYTAGKFTSLRPHLIYDGQPNALTAWLERHNVEIIGHRSRFREALAQLSEREKNPYIATGIVGAFLRVELPQLRPAGPQPDLVLYTDCDIIFQRNVVPELQQAECNYFAVAGEFTPDDYEKMNTGVMLMNLTRLRDSAGKFQDFIANNLETFKDEGWDQAAFRQFYRRPDGTRLWDTLRPELNWKPYWGNNPEAAIIHFHGPKPQDRDKVDRHWQHLKTSGQGAYFRMVEVWQQLLEQAAAT